jgi:hypothetical protein
VAKLKRKTRAAEIDGDGASGARSMPDIPVAAVFSFLKDMRGALTWTLRDLERTLAIGEPDARKIVAILKLQGYVSENDEGQFLTTASGEIVSGSKSPRLKSEGVDRALSELVDRVASVNRDRNSEFKIARAVAFGDFLAGRPNSQAADVGVELISRRSGDDRENTDKFLKHLAAKSLFLHLRAYEPWMSKRSHRRLL